MSIAMKLQRFSDPSVLVGVFHEDHGDTVPAYDKEGALFRAFTSEFRIGDDVFYVQVKAEGLTTPSRFQHDVDALREHDPDLRAWVEQEEIA
jgi:hypothetical protein